MNDSEKVKFVKVEIAFSSVVRLELANGVTLDVNSNQGHFNLTIGRATGLEVAHLSDNGLSLKYCPASEQL